MYVEVKLKYIAVGWSLHNSLEWYNEFLWGKKRKKKNNKFCKPIFRHTSVGYAALG